MGAPPPPEKINNAPREDEGVDFETQCANFPWKGKPTYQSNIRMLRFFEMFLKCVTRVLPPPPLKTRKTFFFQNSAGINNQMCFLLVPLLSSLLPFHLVPFNSKTRLPTFVFIYCRQWALPPNNNVNNAPWVEEEKGVYFLGPMQPGRFLEMLGFLW